MTSGSKPSMEGRSFTLLMGSRWNLFVQNWVQNTNDLSDLKPYKKKFLTLCFMWPSESKRIFFLLRDHNKQSSHKRGVQHKGKVSMFLKISEKNSEFWRQPGKTLLISSEKYVWLCLLVEWLLFTRVELSGGPSLRAHIQLPELKCLESSPGLLLDSTTPCAGSQVRSATHTACLKKS